MHFVLKCNQALSAYDRAHDKLCIFLVSHAHRIVYVLWCF